MEEGIKITDLTVDLGGFKIENLNLNVPRGCVTGLLGRNGAGKTTLIKTIMRQQDAQGGRILYNGLYFPENEVKVLENIACVFDAPHFSLGLKPQKLVKYYRSAYKNFNYELYLKLMQKFNLPQDMRVMKYSLGMQRKLCLVLALCQGADILILDEPTSGIDPLDRREIVGLLQDFLMDEKKTVLFSTHITEDIDKIADYIAIMDGGKIRFYEDKVTLSEDYRVILCDELTPEITAASLGSRREGYGYSVLTRDKDIIKKAVTSRIPTAEDLFVHIEGAEFNPLSF